MFWMELADETEYRYNHRVSTFSLCPSHRLSRAFFYQIDNVHHLTNTPATDPPSAANGPKPTPTAPPTSTTSTPAPAGKAACVCRIHPPPSSRPPAQAAQRPTASATTPTPMPANTVTPTSDGCSSMRRLKWRVSKSVGAGFTGLG